MQHSASSWVWVFANVPGHCPYPHGRHWHQWCSVCVNGTLQGQQQYLCNHCHRSQVLVWDSRIPVVCGRLESCSPALHPQLWRSYTTAPAIMAIIYHCRSRWIFPVTCFSVVMPVLKWWWLVIGWRIEKQKSISSAPTTWMHQIMS